MSYCARPGEFVPCRARQPADVGVALAKRGGLLRRLYDAVIDSRQRQADRMAAAWLARTGGRFTDDIERRMTDRLISGVWRR